MRSAAGLDSSSRPRVLKYRRSGAGSCLRRCWSHVRHGIHAARSAPSSRSGALASTWPHSWHRQFSGSRPSPSTGSSSSSASMLANVSLIRDRPSVPPGERLGVLPGGRQLACLDGSDDRRSPGRDDVRANPRGAFTSLARRADWFCLAHGRQVVVPGLAARVVGQQPALLRVGQRLGRGVPAGVCERGQARRAPGEAAPDARPLRRAVAAGGRARAHALTVGESPTPGSVGRRP